jgi:nucleoside-diphosphate-sugar epimerase
MPGVLADHGHQVTGLDTGFYRDGWLYGQNAPSYPTITADVRHVSDQTLAGFDAVVHLAELSNDPLGEFRPSLTQEMNYGGSLSLAQKCRRVGVSRFVYASSCSVYGLGSDDFKTEESEPNPQTPYARCKLLVERDVSRLANDSFCPTFLRNATAFGASPRMRFDVVLNNLAGMAWTTHRIQLISDGTPWRPLVHVLDIGEAIACVLGAPKELVHNQVFNVGDTSQNYRIREIAEIVAAVFPECSLSFGSADPDNRSYRVSFEKINCLLPGFRCRRDATSGARELHDIFQSIGMSRATFEFRAFTRIKQIKHLVSTGRLDDSLFWTEQAGRRSAAGAGV